MPARKSARGKKEIPDTPTKEGWGKTWVCGPIISDSADVWLLGCGAMFKIYHRNEKEAGRMVVCPLCGRLQQRKNDNVFDPTKVIQQAAHKGKPLLIENAAEAFRKLRLG